MVAQRLVSWQPPSDGQLDAVWRAAAIAAVAALAAGLLMLAAVFGGSIEVMRR